jgi:hypothetical protein
VNGRPTVDQWKGRLQPHSSAILALLLGVGLRILWFQGIGLNDDTEYADAAYRLASGMGLDQYAFGSIDSVRFGMVLPLAAIYRVMGVGNVTSGIFPLVCSSLTMWLTYLVGRALFSHAAGLVALILLATFPLDIVYSTQLVPTVPVATCWTISLLLLVTAERDRRRDRRTAGVLAVASGAALGVAWLCNESGPLFAAALVIWTAATGSSRKLLALAGAGAVAVFLVECVAFRMLCGSFLWRLNIIHFEEQRVLTNTSAAYYPRALFRVLDADFSAQEGHFGWLAYLFLASLPVLVWFRSRRALALWASVLVMMLWFQYGIMTPEGRPIAKWIRYLIVLGPFASLACSEALLLIGRRGGRLMLPVMLGILIATNLLSANAAQAANAEQLRDFKATAAAIRDLPSDTPVFVGEGESGFLDIYLGRQRPLHVVEQADLSALDDSFVVLYGSRNALENPPTRLKTQALAQAARAGWHELARIRGADTGIFAQFDPTIYYVPARRSTPLRRLATINDPTGDVMSSPQTRLPAFVPDVVEANVSVDSERQTLEFEWRFKDPVPQAVNRRDLGLVCFWRLTMDGSDPWSTAPDYFVRLGWYPGGVGLFVDDGRVNNAFTFDDQCGIQHSYRITGSSARAIVPIRCFRKAGEEMSSSSWQAKATFEAATAVRGRWIARDIGSVASIP